MRGKVVAWAMALSLVTLISCQKQGTSPDSEFTVSGRVYYLGRPIQEVSVSIDSKAEWTTQTDSSGSFSIQGVSSGKHLLRLRKNFGGLRKSVGDAGPFSERTIDIAVTQDLVFDFLKLPKAVVLYEPTDITTTSAKLSWSPTDEEDFREYKLYRHDTPGLDETTGTLVYVSTAKNDTSFVDNNLDPLHPYYYRVYVMNEYGRIGGSNIVQVQTQNIQLVHNGGFEEVSGETPTGWSVVANTRGNPENYIVVDSTTAFEGNHSLKFHHAEENGCWEMWITQVIKRDLLTPGDRYRLDLAMKADFSGDLNFDLILRTPTKDTWLPVRVQIETPGEWKTVSYEFALPDDIGNNDVEMSIHFCVPRVCSWWLDAISLRRAG